MYDEGQITRITAAVRKAVENGSVLAVTEHFAGYFDELGITISVKADTPDELVLALKEKVAPVLLGSTTSFEWIVIFERGGKQAGVLFPDGRFATNRLR